MDFNNISNKSYDARYKVEHEKVNFKIKIVFVFLRVYFIKKNMFRRY